MLPLSIGLMLGTILGGLLTYRCTAYSATISAGCSTHMRFASQTAGRFTSGLESRRPTLASLLNAQNLLLGHCDGVGLSSTLAHELGVLDRSADAVL